MKRTEYILNILNNFVDLNGFNIWGLTLKKRKSLSWTCFVSSIQSWKISDNKLVKYDKKCINLTEFCVVRPQDRYR